MSYELYINKKPEYIHLTYSGVVSLDERQKAKHDVLNACFDNNFYRALVDLRESDLKMTQSDVIQFASSFKETKLPDNYRLACIVSDNNQTENLIEIIISLDGVNIKYFINMDDAKDWLTSI